MIFFLVNFTPKILYFKNFAIHFRILRLPFNTYFSFLIIIILFDITQQAFNSSNMYHIGDNFYGIWKNNYYERKRNKHLNKSFKFVNPQTFPY